LKEFIESMQVMAMGDEWFDNLPPYEEESDPHSTGLQVAKDYVAWLEQRV
jgi:hypothetical protein